MEYYLKLRKELMAVIGVLMPMFRAVGATFMLVTRLLVIGIGLLSRAFVGLLISGGPVVWTIAAVAAAAALLWYTWDTIGPRFWACWGAVKDSFGQFWTWVSTWISGAMQTLIEDFQAAWEDLKGFFTHLWAEITAPFDAFIQGDQEKIAQIRSALGMGGGGTGGPSPNDAGGAERQAPDPSGQFDNNPFLFPGAHHPGGAAAGGQFGFAPLEVKFTVDGPGKVEAPQRLQPIAPQADPLVAAGVLLAALPLLQSLPGDQPLAAALFRAARVQAVGEAARAASGADWDSRDEAITWRGIVDAAPAGVQAELAAAGAGPAWRSLREVRTAWARDMNEAIGRLPLVQHFTIAATLSAWEIALAAAGDAPAAIRPALLDFVRRNRIRHPGLVAPGIYELVGTGLRACVDTAVGKVGIAAVAAASGEFDPDAFSGEFFGGGGAAAADVTALLLSIGGEIITIGGEPIYA